MGISGVQQNPYVTPQVRAQEPSGIAIEQGHISQINGYNQGQENGDMGLNLLETADGALSSISDSLQRIRELAVQASNTALYSGSDRSSMQKEVDQLKEHISDVAKYTHFNQKNLLDGSMADIHLATNPSGGGMDIKTTDATLEALGLKDFDLTGDFDLDTIDQALKKVEEARSSIGAQSSALAYTIQGSSEASYNMTSSLASLEDTDIGAMVSENKKKEIMQNYNYFLIKQKKEDDKNFVSKMLT